MKRKVHITGLVALLLTANAVRTSPAVAHLAYSARSFRMHFHDLSKARDSLTPLERLIFSLVLSRSDCARTAVPETAERTT